MTLYLIPSADGLRLDAGDTTPAQATPIDLRHDSDRSVAELLFDIGASSDAAERMLAEDLAATPARTCRQCGCTDNAACWPACHWVEPDLCSSCADAGGVRPRFDDAYDLAAAYERVTLDEREEVRHA